MHCPKKQANKQTDQIGTQTQVYYGTLLCSTRISQLLFFIAIDGRIEARFTVYDHTWTTTSSVLGFGSGNTTCQPKKNSGNCSKSVHDRDIRSTMHCLRLRVQLYSIVCISYRTLESLIRARVSALSKSSPALLSINKSSRVQFSHHTHCAKLVTASKRTLTRSAYLSAALTCL